MADTKNPIHAACDIAYSIRRQVADNMSLGSYSRETRNACVDHAIQVYCAERIAGAFEAARLLDEERRRYEQRIR